MLQYERTGSCRMQLLQQQLDDPSAGPCGRCDVCAGAWFPGDVPEGASGDAARALDGVGVEIAPRAQWPSGMEALGVPVRGKLDAGERVFEGRVVARLTDLGWGGPLRTLFAATAADQPVPQQLVDACVRTLQDWPWSERPTAVVAMPSRGRPQLVASLAQTISSIGRLPLLGALEIDGAPARRGDGAVNSAYRLSGVWEGFSVGADLAAALAEHRGPVLLVDDLVDSRWTLTVAGRVLRRAGADAVLPFALASVA